VNVKNIYLTKSAFWLSSLAALAIFNNSAAHAQTIQPDVNATVLSANEANTTPQLDQASSVTIPVPQPQANQTILPSNEVSAERNTAQQLVKPNETTANIVVPVPQPQKNQTTITVLPNSELPTQQPITEFSTTKLPQLSGTGAIANSTIPTTQPTAQPNQIAQSDIEFGRGTRGGSSYVGVGANIGLTGGSSSIGDGNFAILSKIGFSRTFSVRPSILLGDNSTILVPVTYDFSFQQLGDPFEEPFPIAPYLGVGAAFRTGDNSDTAFLVTGGVDVPINRQLTFTGAVNAGFFNETDIGFLLGVGYNFSGF
jgi:hypothetical protein